MFCPKCGEKVENNQAYCNRCGNYLGNFQNMNQVNNQYNFNNRFNANTNFNNINTRRQNKKMIFIGLSVGLIILIIIFIYATIFGNSNYYFSTNDYNKENEIINTNRDNKDNKKDDDDDDDETETIKNNKNKTNQKKKKYSTVIVADNKYSNMKIRNEDDAYELIVEDSVNQKNTTPTEIKNIENTIINEYGVTAVNLCEIDVEFAKEIEKVFEKIYKEYPSVRGDLTNLTLVNAPISESYIAAFMPAFSFATSDSKSGYPYVIKTQVLLNTKYFLNTDRLEASVKDGSKSGHFPPNATIYSPVAHELGHYLSFLAMMRYYDVDSILLVDNENIADFYLVFQDFVEGNFSLLMIQEAYNNYKKDVKTTLTLDEWRATISNYAVAKDKNGEYIYDETIAEAFHDVYLNGDSAKDASKYVVAVLKQKLER